MASILTELVDPEPLWFGVAVHECSTPTCSRTVECEEELCDECAAELLDIRRQVRLLDAGAVAAPVA